MALPRAPFAALLAVLLPLQALAQGPQAPAASDTPDDELLAPLTPAKPPAPRKAPRHSAPAEDDELLAPLVTKPTALRVRIPPALTGARLLVDGEDLGALPGANVDVRPGTHHVRVRRAGYRDYSTRVYTPEGRVTEVGAQLVPVAGVLWVTADVPGARVQVDGRAAGVAPLEGLLLGPGLHEVRVQREGFGEQRTQLTVRAGQDYRVRARLQAAGTDRPLASPGAAVALAAPALSEPASAALAPLPAFSPPAPWFKRWYVWAGVGALATAAVVGTVAATRSPGAAQPFSPGEVCGGSCDGVLGAARPQAR